MAEIYGNTTTTPINPDAFADGGSGIIDLTYNPQSENAQSGKAVAGVLGNIETALDSIIEIQNTLIGGDS